MIIGVDLGCKATKSGLSILLHGVLSLLDATVCDKPYYC